MKRRLFALTTAATALGLALGAAAVSAQTKWDLPAAYPASNFHTENITQFAKDVDTATGGKLKITVHANASLFKAPEIKRAVQGGQAQIGEILLVNFENENPIFGADGIPFLASSFADSKKLYAAQKPVLDKVLGAQGMKLLYAVAWPPQGLYVKKELASVADMRGVKWRAYSPSTAKVAELIGAQPVTVHLQCGDRVVPLTVFPHERLAHCPIPIDALLAQLADVARDFLPGAGEVLVVGAALRPGHFHGLDRAAGLQHLADLGKQLLAQLVPLQQVPKLQHRGLVGHPLVTQIDARKAAHRLRLQQFFFQSRVAQVVPMLQEVQS